MAERTNVSDGFYVHHLREVRDMLSVCRTDVRYGQERTLELEKHDLAYLASVVRQEERMAEILVRLDRIEKQLEHENVSGS